MKKGHAAAIVAGASIASGLLGWFLFRHREVSGVEGFYGRQATRLGFDKSWYIKVGYTVKNASEGRCNEVSDSDYQDLYKVLASGKPPAQRNALLAIGNCPPPDREACYAKLSALAQSTQDATIQEWTLAAMWGVAPKKHDEIRRMAAASNYSGVGEDVAKWPEKLTKN